MCFFPNACALFQVIESQPATKTPKCTQKKKPKRRSWIADSIGLGLPLSERFFVGKLEIRTNTKKGSQKQWKMVVPVIINTVRSKSFPHSFWKFSLWQLIGRFFFNHHGFAPLQHLQQPVNHPLSPGVTNPNPLLSGVVAPTVCPAFTFLLTCSCTFSQT